MSCNASKQVRKKDVGKKERCKNCSLQGPNGALQGPVQMGHCMVQMGGGVQGPNRTFLHAFLSCEAGFATSFKKIKKKNTFI